MMAGEIVSHKLGLLFLSLMCSLTAYGQKQIVLTNLDTTKLPKGIAYVGKIKQAVGWPDKLGDNIVITTETGETPSKTEPVDDFRDAALYGYHFVQDKNGFNLNWKVYDVVSDCPVDIEAYFVKNTFNVTDLDKDGIGEIWLMYRTVCRGDVSPAFMKVIMYEGKQKFAMRGSSKLGYYEDENDGGEYVFDSAFRDAPAVFRDFAKELWAKNIMETRGK